MVRNSRIYAVLPAAGSSTRMGGVGVSKVLLPVIGGLTVFDLNIRNLVMSGVFAGIAVATRPGDEDEIRRLLAANVPPGLEQVVVAGGKSRQQSVLNAVQALCGRADFVAVHDAARPFCRPQLIRDVVDKAQQTGAAILAISEPNTLKLCSEQRVVTKTIARDNVWQAQTPQVFGFDLLLEGLRKAQADGCDVTDEAMAVELLGYPVSVVPGDSFNIKITSPEDLKLAEMIATGILAA